MVWYQAQEGCDDHGAWKKGDEKVSQTMHQTFPTRSAILVIAWESSHWFEQVFLQWNREMTQIGVN